MDFLLATSVCDLTLCQDSQTSEDRFSKKALDRDRQTNKPHLSVHSQKVNKTIFNFKKGNFIFGKSILSQKSRYPISDVQMME